MKKIKKLISIGSNCISANIIKSVGMREPGPVDNLNGVNVWKSQYLFSSEIKIIFFNLPYKFRKSSDFEKEKYHFLDKIYLFQHGIEIVHNNFESKKFQKSLKKRISRFHNYYRKSKKDDSLWYIYSLNPEDENLTDGEFQKIVSLLPDCCKSRLICIGIRAKNPLFEKYFKYYIEYGNEKDFKWDNRNYSEKIMKELSKKYELDFELYKRKFHSINVFDTGLFCFIKIASTLGIRSSFKDIYKNVDADFSSFKGIIQVAKFYNLIVRVVKGSEKSIYKKLITPFIVLMHSKNKNGVSIEYYAVVKQIYKKYISLWNPSIIQKNRIVKYSEFINEWTGYALFFSKNDMRLDS